MNFLTECDIPTSVKEVQKLGWDYIDVIIFTGDAFVDHPSFGTACIARYLQKHGYRVAVVPQPNWQDDLRDFRKLGKPRLYFAVNAGAMDSMVNHYTAARRLRHNDAYTPDGRFGQRPDRAVTVYTKMLKRLWPEVPVVIGGVEASLRRLCHYDYWADRLMPSILVDSGADWLCYGMGERTMLELTKAMESGRNLHQIEKIPQIAFLRRGTCKVPDARLLHSFEACLADRKAFAENFHDIDMIRDSIITHRGCFGGCNFCTIAAHQGKFIQSRSEKSILEEVRRLVAMPEFRGNISDLGAPTANMYGMRGKDASKCGVCRRKSCLFPSPCPNMDRSHVRLLKLYRDVDAVKGVRHSYIGSGVRYDLFLDDKGFNAEGGREYLRELLLRHTSGRLKVAPEHTEEHVLRYMAKPSFRLFETLRREFDRINREEGTHTELVPYFISSHPGCTLQDMRRLSANPCLKGIWMEQVQDFMPTPMTTSSVMFYTGLDPRDMKPVFVERDPERKKEQKSLFFRK